MISSDGITGGFFGINAGGIFPKSATHDNYYDVKEVAVVVSEDKTLHVLRDGDKFRLTLFLLNTDDIVKGTTGIKLDSVPLDVMARAVEDGVLCVGGMQIQLLNTRSLKRIL